MRPDREQATRMLMELDVPGSGPLELARREAEAIVDAYEALPVQVTDDPWPEVKRLFAEAVAKAHGPVQVTDEMATHNDKVAELARAAFALQELRYLAWTALKAWDNMSLRRAQQTGTTGAAMEAMRAALPLASALGQNPSEHEQLRAAATAVREAWDGGLNPHVPSPFYKRMQDAFRLLDKALG